MTLRILTINADSSGSYFYRIKQPFAALNAVGVKMTPIIHIPSSMEGAKLPNLYELIAEYDLVVVQRCFEYGVVKIIRQACDLLGKRMVFETDDDCLHVAESNPAYKSLVKHNLPILYPEILRMADAITVSTPELRDTIHQYNRNVFVFPNNVESILCGERGLPKRDCLEEFTDDNGLAIIPQQHGLVAIPAYRSVKQTNGIVKKEQIVRIGYSATPSHAADFDTILRSLDKVCERYGSKVWLVIFGDRGIYEKTKGARKRGCNVVTTHNIQQYFWHLRNIDIGLAPLVKNLFNMSKSPIKALEYGMWGTPAVLPNYVTYAREFTNNKNCLMYNNSKEFEDGLCELIENEDLRLKLGMAARDLIKAKRLEGDPANYMPRYQLYQALADSSRVINYREND